MWRVYDSSGEFLTEVKSTQDLRWLAEQEYLRKQGLHDFDGQHYLLATPPGSKLLLKVWWRDPFCITQAPAMAEVQE